MAPTRPEKGVEKSVGKMLEILGSLSAFGIGDAAFPARLILGFAVGLADVLLPTVNLSFPTKPTTEALAEMTPKVRICYSRLANLMRSAVKRVFLEKKL